MAKKGGGSGCAVVALIVFGVIASVPKEAWVGIGILTAIGFVIYFAVKSGSSSAPKGAPNEPSVQVRVSTSSYRRPRSPVNPSVTAESCWQPPGTVVTVAGYGIAGGVYVGQGLGDIAGGSIEPALIDPKLGVRAPAGPFETLGYWPSYAKISDAARGSYLKWLAGGRKEPVTEIGYVFLFFYGLERRLLADNPGGGHLQRELPWARHEVARLLEQYGSMSGSFKGYATSFLEFLSLSDIASESSAYDVAPPEPPELRRLSLPLLLGLGKAASEKLPIRSDWAYSWAMSDERIRLRTAAQRCEVQFKELFVARYREVYGEGMKITAPKSKLRAVYKPASASFGHRILEYKFDNIPDISVAEGPVRRLAELVDQVTDMLGPYSRFIAREPSKADSMQALLLLPPTLWPDQHVTKLGQWLSEIGADQTPQAIGFGELIRHFPTWEEINKEKMGAFSMALETLGVGMEPDVRWGGPMPEEGDPVVLFPLEKNERLFAPSALYRAAALTLRLAAMVTVSDGSSSVDEEGHLESQIERWPDLTPLERKRLRSFLKWLLMTKPSMSGLKRLAKDLDELQKRGLATFLVHVAQAEGGVSPKELKALGKIYRLLGLNEDELYSHAHAAATEPVTVRTATAPEKRYAIPAKPESGAPAVAQLDTARIEQLKKESEEVSKLLAGIFSETGPEPAAVAPEPEPEAPAPSGPFKALDAEHSSFAQLIIGRSQWTRAELEDLAEDRNLMLDGALEKINEAVLDQFQEPLFEGSDSIEINTNVLKELREHEHNQAARA